MKKEWNFEIREEKFFMDGRWVPLLCGEIHYFRIPKEYWGKVLDRLKEAGCNAVAYYVPWFVHEYEEGKFDFRGEICPENDLHTWIRMTMERNLAAYFRPGPYVYAETADLGIPGWFTKGHPDALVKRYTDGEYRNTDFANSVARNHPEYLEAVERWYKAVCSEISRYQMPEGNIVMFQLCNEIPGDDYNDENPVNLGIGKEDGIWPDYLRRTYRTIEALNGHYHTAFEKWEWIEPYMLRQADAEKYEKDHLEYYYGTYYPVYFQRLRAMAEKYGIHVQMTHNAYNPRAVSLHYQNKKQNPWLCIGVDCYYSLNGRLGMKEATYYCEFGAGYSRSFLGNVPWVIEHECGYWHDYPEVYGPELYIWNIWTMASGYQGINMYLFAGGVNRPGMGFYGTEHNWQAPVNYRGQCSETYPYIKRSLEDIWKNREVFLSEQEYDIGFGIKHSPGLIWEPVARVGNEAFFVLKEAGFNPFICDFEGMTDKELAEWPVLMIVSDEYMDEEVQRKLVSYMEQGGSLVISGRVPDRTEKGIPCTVLADSMGIKVERTPLTDEVQQKMILNKVEYYIGKKIQTFRTEVLETVAEDKEGKTAAVKGRVGNGHVLVLPFALEMQFSGLKDAVRMLLGEAGAVPMIETDPNLRVIPKRSGECIVLNLHPVKIKADICYKKSTPISIEMEPYSFQILRELT